MGIQFHCPCSRCLRVRPDHARDLYAWFLNPIDGGPAVHPQIEPLGRYRVLGEIYNFQTLTIVPAINAYVSGHWCGFIINGDCIDTP